MPDEQPTSIWERFDIRGETAAVIGGSGVLGGAMARALGQAGARVAVIGRRAEAARQVADDIGAAGGVARSFVCDARDRPALEQVEREITEALGPVSILVNAAGGNAPLATTSPDRSFFALEADALRGVVDDNLLTTLIGCQVFGRGMATLGRGAIITIASMSGLRPLTHVPVYSAAKAGVINFTQWLAVYLAQDYSPRIRVNAIAPGFFLTEQNRSLLTEGESSAPTPRAQAILAHTPMGRLGAPDDLVGALLWLVSPAAAFVTGIVVPVDGGFSAFGGV